MLVTRGSAMALHTTWCSSLAFIILILSSAPHRADAQPCPASVSTISGVPDASIPPAPSPQLPGNQRESSLAIDPTNVQNWIVAYMDFNTTGPCGNRNRVFVRTTQSLSTSWNAPIELTVNLGNNLVDSYDPVVAFDNCGRACAMWVEREVTPPNPQCTTIWTRIFAKTSIDKGLTWSPPILLDGYTSGTTFVDKPQLVAAPALSACDLNCASVSANLYAVWTRHTQYNIPGLPPFDGEVRFGKSVDGGNTWAQQSVTSPIPTGIAYAYATLTASVNKVIIGWIWWGAPVTGQGTFLSVSSVDCGNTFSNEQKGFTFYILYPGAVGPYTNGIAGDSRAFSLPTMAAIGNTLVVVVAEQLGQLLPSRLIYNTSGNLGAASSWTWSGLGTPNQPCPLVADVTLADDSFDPMMVASGPTLFLTYFDRRRSTQFPPFQSNRLLDCLATGVCCVAAGVPGSGTPLLTWAPSVLLNSTISDPWFGSPTTGFVNFGDYNGLGMLVPNVAVGTWTDMRPTTPATLQDLWRNAFALSCSGDSEGLTIPDPLSMAQGGEILLTFRLPGVLAGAPYQMFGSSTLGPSQSPSGRRWIPLGADSFAAALWRGNGPVSAIGLSGSVPESGIVRASVRLSAGAVSSRTLYFMLAAGERLEHHSGVVRARLID
jgi:hypothetical protein